MPGDIGYVGAFPQTFFHSASKPAPRVGVFRNSEAANSRTHAGDGENGHHDVPNHADKGARHFTDECGRAAGFLSEGEPVPRFFDGTDDLCSGEINQKTITMICRMTATTLVRRVGSGRTGQSFAKTC